MKNLKAVFYKELQNLKTFLIASKRAGKEKAIINVFSPQSDVGLVLMGIGSLLFCFGAYFYSFL